MITSPCKECIVISMCMKECPKLVDFIRDEMKSYNIELIDDNFVNAHILRLLAANTREGVDTDDDFFYFCVGPHKDLFRLYVKYQGGEIKRMRLSDE